MATFLITSFAVLAVILLGLYLWRKPSISSQDNLLPPPTDARGLFVEVLPSNTSDEDRLKIMNELLEQASQNDLSALDKTRNDTSLYDRVLTQLTRGADTNSKLHSLMSYVGTRALPVNKPLAQAIIESWIENPTRAATAKALHFAALSDDAELYREAVESTLRLWREGRIADTPPAELRALFDGEFWVLSSRTRSSGAGFVLKRTLAGARRELEAAGAIK